MRTIKIEVSPEPRSGMHMTISTEVIVDDDNAYDAGKEAQQVIQSFITGFGENAD